MGQIAHPCLSPWDLVAFLSQGQFLGLVWVGSFRGPGTFPQPNSADLLWGHRVATEWLLCDHCGHYIVAVRSLWPLWSLYGYCEVTV
jgi:hypothetical protein